MSEEEVFTVEEVARKLKVNPETVRVWIRTGELIAFDTGRGYRIMHPDLDEFISRRKTNKRQKQNDQNLNRNNEVR